MRTQLRFLHYPLMLCTLAALFSASQAVRAKAETGVFPPKGMPGLVAPPKTAVPNADVDNAKQMPAKPHDQNVPRNSWNKSDQGHSSVRVIRYGEVTRVYGMD